MQPEPQPAPSSPRRWTGLLLLAVSTALIGASLWAGVTWFNDTLIGRSNFDDVSRTFGRLGPLPELQGDWFRSFFLIPAITAALLLVTSLPRSRGSRLTVGLLWVIAALLVLALLPVGIAAENDFNERYPNSAGENTGEFITGLVLVVLVALTSLILAWAAYRGRTVGPAVVGTVVAMVAASVHLILLILLLSGSGDERVSVALGPWLVAVGLVTLAVAGVLLVTAASRSRDLAADTLWNEPDPRPQGTELS